MGEAPRTLSAAAGVFLAGVHDLLSRGFGQLVRVHDLGGATVLDGGKEGILVTKERYKKKKEEKPAMIPLPILPSSWKESYTGEHGMAVCVLLVVAAIETELVYKFSCCCEMVCWLPYPGWLHYTALLCSL